MGGFQGTVIFQKIRDAAQKWWHSVEIRKKWESSVFASSGSRERSLDRQVAQFLLHQRD
jgi:hypothetical protein